MSLDQKRPESGGATSESPAATPLRPEVHLDLKVRGMRPSATVALNERCDALRQEGKLVFKLGLGQSPFPVPRPVIEEMQANAHHKAYLPVKGLPALREAVADNHRRQLGIPAAADQVLIGPGSKELMFLLQLVYYGDLVIPTPAWVSYAPQAHILGRQVKWIHTLAANGWRLTPARRRGPTRKWRQPRRSSWTAPARSTSTATRSPGAGLFCPGRQGAGPPSRSRLQSGPPSRRMWRGPTSRSRSSTTQPWTAPRIR